MITCEILIGYDDHMSLYLIGQETIEKCLRAESSEQVNDLIVDEGMAFPIVDINRDGAVFFNMMDTDDMSFGEFQDALMEFTEDVGA